MAHEKVNKFSVTDIILENRVARLLHSVLGEEGKLWDRSYKDGEPVIFALVEKNAMDFVLKIFDNDARIIPVT